MKQRNLIKAVALLCLPLQSLAATPTNDSMLSCDKCNYVELKGGVVQPTTLQGNSGLGVGDTTYTFGFAVGRKFKDQFGVELEYMHRNKNNTSAAVLNGTGSNAWGVKSDTLMLNLSADLITDSKVRPYVKIGAGISKNTPSTFTNTDYSVSPIVSTNTYSGKKENKFAWQVGFGVDVETSPMFITQLQYMYINRGKIKTSSDYTSTVTNNGETLATVQSSGTAYTGKLQDHVITLGVKIKF